jgi:hypothetical protein
MADLETKNRPQNDTSLDVSMPHAAEVNEFASLELASTPQIERVKDVELSKPIENKIVTAPKIEIDDLLNTDVKINLEKDNFRQAAPSLEKEFVLQQEFKPEIKVEQSESKINYKQWSTNSANPIDRLINHFANLLKMLEQIVLKFLQKKGPLKLKTKIITPIKDEPLLEKKKRARSWKDRFFLKIDR